MFESSRIVAARAALMSAILMGCAFLGLPATALASAPERHYHVVAELPHETSAFTEGLTLLDGRLLESTGIEGRSFLTLRDLRSGALLKRYKLADRDFGEGAAVAGNRIVQLTWRSGVGYVYDFNLQLLDSFNIDTEGWGLTYDGRFLIRSDGSSNLRFLSTDNYAEVRRLEVHDGKRTVSQLNELEWANGRIYANVWHDTRIAVIDPADGHVIEWIDLGDLDRRLVKPRDWDANDDVLNGIAFDPASGHFFVTGKCWPKMFEIALDPVNP